MAKAGGEQKTSGFILQPQHPIPNGPKAQRTRSRGTIQDEACKVDGKAKDRRKEHGLNGVGFYFL